MLFHGPMQGGTKKILRTERWKYAYSRNKNAWMVGVLYYIYRGTDAKMVDVIEALDIIEV